MPLLKLPLHSLPLRANTMQDDEHDVEDEEYEANAPRRRGRRQADEEGDGTGGLIPYKNPSALIAYYCGLFSLLPVLGFFLGAAGLILGIKGLRARSRNPAIKGSVHAWIGIIMGGLFMLIWGGLIVIFIIAAITHKP